MDYNQYKNLSEQLLVVRKELRHIGCLVVVIFCLILLIVLGAKIW